MRFGRESTLKNHSKLTKHSHSVDNHVALEKVGEALKDGLKNLVTKVNKKVEEESKKKIYSDF